MFDLHDRVYKVGKPEMVGTVFGLTDNRAQVAWDDKANEVVNQAMLRPAKKPVLSTFCSYCMGNFHADKKKEPTVGNTSNGAAFHLECARIIKRAVEQYEMDLMTKDLTDAKI